MCLVDKSKLLEFAFSLLGCSVLAAGIFSMPKPGWRSLFKRGKSTAQTPPSDPLPSLYYCNAVYYPSWRAYRQQAPSSMNLERISHIFYAFASVKEDGTIYLNDEYADTEIDVNGVKGCLNDLRAIKQQYPHIKTLLSIGGGGKGSAPLPRVAAGEESRSRFAWTAEEIVEVYSLDGIDVDWEYPSSFQQGHDYVHLLSALRRALPAPQYLITSALPAGEWVLKNINLKRAALELDYINLMTYDFSGPWTSICGHHAQLYTPKRPHNDANRTSCSSSIAYVLAQGVPSEKILMGIPTYGRSFLGASKTGDTFSGHAGDEGTFEYRDLPRPRASARFDDDVGGAYCVGGDGGFVSYDNPKSVSMKTEFVKQQKLGGLFYWTGTGDTNDSKSLVEAGWSGLQR